MRLGIRRKLIGTLMLVGLLPLALSLAVILGGGAALRLHSIRNAYEHKAADTANQIAATIGGEADKLLFLSRLPQVIQYAKEQTEAQAARRHLPWPAKEQVGGTAVPSQPDDYSHELDQRWDRIGHQDDPLRKILHNPLADRLRAMSNFDAHPRQMLATDAWGETIGADVKPGDYFQADEVWWREAYDGGKGRGYISTVVANPAGGGSVVEVAVPIFDEAGRVVGIIKEKFDVSSLREPLGEVVMELGATGQLLDLTDNHTVLATEDGGVTRRAEGLFLKYGPRQEGFVGALWNDLLYGSAGVPFERQYRPQSLAFRNPQWAVLVSKPAQEAMIPVYRLALIVAAIGIALILVLFILGVAIANREIIMPIIRLREATEAVGRGELNVRLISDEQSKNATFRSDELGQLAEDFDEMTRELQKSVGQLARSNEAKRRFMELAGHELRTPVTYILGVCQLAQRQLQSSPPTDEKDANPAGPRNTPTAVNPSLTKIAAKAQRLSRIIENLLKLVNNDQFTTRLNKQPVDLRELIQQVCNDARPFINDRKQNLVVDLAENLPIIDGDRDKLEDALTNLVSNAVRFTPDGGAIKIAARPVVGDMLEILVEDSGPGIPQADLQNLFEPFYTGTDIMHHHSGTTEFGSKGIGLGLAIVRRFIEIHGGVVRAHSSPQGTQFQILLPLPTSANGTARA